MNLLTNLPQNLVGELCRTTEMFLAWFENSKLSGLTFIEKKLSFQAKLGFPASIITVKVEVHFSILYPMKQKNTLLKFKF